MSQCFSLTVECLAQHELGEHGQALAVAEHLLAFVGTSHPLWRARALAIKAKALTRLSRPALAVECLAEAQHLLTKHQDGTYVHRSALVNMSVALQSMRMYEVAERWLEQPVTAPVAFQIYTASAVCQGRALWGTSEDLAGRPDRARQHYLVCASRATLHRRVALDTGMDTAALTRPTVYEAFAFERLGDADLARALLLPVVAGDLPEDCDEHDVAYLTVGRIAVHRGELDRARDHFERVVANATQTGRDLWRLAAEQALAALEVVEHGDHPAAARWRAQAVELMAQLTDDDETRVQDLAERTLTHQLRETSEELTQAALLDPLTGLANRRALQLWLTGLDDQHGAVFVDVDHFKAVNDTFSHQVGDQVLQRIGRLLTASCRTGDRIVRYGGDEFFVIVSGGPHAARAAGDRIHATIRQHDWAQIAAGLHVTVSVGVAAHLDGETVAMGAADGALYAAKRAGRDRVVMLDPAA